MIELLVATALLLLVSGLVTSALLQVTRTQTTIWNRTEMHSGVRGATELLQQEVGQAGRVTLPSGMSLTGAVAAVLAQAGVTATSSMFVGEQLIIDTGDKEETVTVTAVDTASNQITATFVNAHNAGAPVTVAGGFANGIVPPDMANGSTENVLKLFGDINGDGNMVYVEYTCDTAVHSLYRNMVAWNAAAKPALTPSQVLLGNIIANPNGTPCFTYQTQVVGANTYVTDVAITLTVQTQQVDPVTKQYQTETKALLNVSPRNVFNAWELASIGLTNRIQPTPAAVQQLLP